ncbi:MAG: F-type H+-transporting ATPase subunit epsilon [Pelagibacterales bacterium]|nr:F-type H+-transporting ATPase subunit epsilon [Pelagibacterales bacterium]
MEENFNIEIISPEKVIFSNKTKIVKIPSYEGDMSLLKDHISIIAFLRPGIVKVSDEEGSFQEFFVQDGIAEFFNNTLILLSSSIESKKDLSKEFLENLSQVTKDKLQEENITDEERYTLNHKLDAIKEINI